jgi:hypothetical protein
MKYPEPIFLDYSDLPPERRFTPEMDLEKTILAIRSHFSSKKTQLKGESKNDVPISSSGPRYRDRDQGSR